MISFDIDPAKLAEVRARQGSSTVTAPVETAAPKRGRGRPRKVVAPAPEPEEMQATESQLGFEPAPFISVDEKKLAQRLQGFFTGTTGIAGAFIVDYLRMTDEEAEAIAEPLASYLLRRAPDSESIQQFVENYDLLAIITGTTAYAGRVYRDRKEDVENERLRRRASVVSGTNAASANVAEEPTESGTEPENPIASPLDSIFGEKQRGNGRRRGNER